MSFVISHRVNDKPVTNFYEKVATDGDISNVVSEAPGKEVLLPWSAGVFSSAEKSVTFELPFHFLLNQNQLQVSWEGNNHEVSPPTYIGWHRIMALNTISQIPTFNPAIHPYYEELSSNTVVIFNLDKLTPAPFLNNNTALLGQGQNNTFLFSVPHTALPGTNNDKVLVENQGDNIAIEFLGSGDGIVMRSPSGKKILLRMDESGPVGQELL